MKKTYEQPEIWCKSLNSANILTASNNEYSAGFNPSWLDSLFE